MEVRCKVVVSLDDLHSLGCKAGGCQPPSRAIGGGGESSPPARQLTAGGEEPFNNTSSSERLRSSCEPATETHCIRLLKQDMTHASFPYASA